MSDCVQSINVICKHVESNDTYYVDLAPRLGTGETVSSITSVTPSDANMTAGTGSVIGTATTITTTSRDEQGNTTTNTYTIAANKGASFTLTGGSSGAGCGTVTVKFVKSTGKTDAVDCLVEVHGVDVLCHYHQRHSGVQKEPRRENSSGDQSSRVDMVVSGNESVYLSVNSAQCVKCAMMPQLMTLITLCHLMG